METNVDSYVSRRPGEMPALEVRLLGPMTVSRSGIMLLLPPSRKVRALFAYLALTPHPVTRSRLCDLLWDVPQDPRGELRWCLSKIRGLVDDPGRSRVQTQGETIRMDLLDCRVDAVEIGTAAAEGIEKLSAERLRALSTMFAGEFLDGLEIDRSPLFETWLTAERRRFRSCRLAVLERLAQIASGDEVFPHLEAWLQLAPFDERVHATLLSALARRGRIHEGDEHLTATVRLFEDEGLDHARIRDLWHSAVAEAKRSGQSYATATAPAAAPGGNPQPSEAIVRHRASVAVMPFANQSPDPNIPGGIGGSLAHDVVTRLAKLRNLFVIAQGTVFALSESRVDAQEAGRMLNVDYVVSGTSRRQGNHVTVTVELTEARTARIVWAEVYSQALENTFVVLDEIGDRIVASIDAEIETVERNRAVLKPPGSLDAWEAHHRGLWHMYRFNRADNERAQHFFETAVALDPTFSRAHAGLSFTHFQNAFQGWNERAAEIDRAFAAAGQSLMADDRDPAAHWAMGRALWLRGHQDQSVAEVETAVDLSPNFAIAHYTLAFIHCQGGDPEAAIRFSDHSRRLSPFDPLLFAMLGARAMALVRLGRFEEAADWALKASARPNAHPHIQAIAAYSLALAGRLDEARVQLGVVHTTRPHYSIEDFLTAMKFSADGEAFFRKAATRI
ncbi:MAG TPA: BTAD domain-containing putative transcriptional regulator [Acidisoma sp.]|uniref:BTAD domain-containing putative transcriptional regulator n=1 Tax=Acidisoma sp. TaxID=1872115 RepID=UPI002C22D287|nr:BTAD domain-containing putative transcriptional regulator [Acidisoma sp.]HTI01166.1 BTAD domain-containing putative transcriptional regulator [Acidisoma sp.]